MTTAREKAEAFAASYLYGTDDSDAITHAARQLLAIVDQRFAELREKEKEGCGSNSPAPLDRSVSSSAQAGSATLSLQSEGGNADDWVPTEDFVNEQARSHFGDYPGWKVHAVRELLKTGALNQREYQAGRRIAREDQCSNTSSAVSSPRVSFSSATTSTEAERTAVATKPVAPTESSTPSPKSGAKSLDERAEALFAANPEWRPRYGYQTLHLISGMDAWRWVDVPIGMSRGFVLQPDRNAHLLSALLPRAIEEWARFHCTEAAPEFVYRSKTVVPRDLESAIRVLEGK